MSGRLLLQEGDAVPLTPKAFELLKILVEHHGEVVDKETLMKTLWPDTFVEDSNLNFNVYQLRKALGDDGNEQRFIRTVQTIGYCFVAAVTQAQSRVADMPPADESGGDNSPPTHLSPRNNMRILAAMLIVAVVSAALFAYGRRSASPEPATPEAGPSSSVGPVSPRRSLAVLDLRNAAGRSSDDWLSRSLAEMLSTELAAGGRIRITPREDVVRMKTDLALDETESFAHETLRQIAATLNNTDLVVTGAYVVAGEGQDRPIRLDLRLQETANGGVLASVSAGGTETGLFALVSDAGARLRAQLQVGDLSVLDVEGVRASIPSHPATAKAYLEGLARLRESDPLGARDFFVEAINLDPESPLVHAALSEAWLVLGYDQHARLEAKRAFDLSGKLSQPQRLRLEAGYRRQNHEWELALEVYQRLRGFFPDDPEYVIQLAEVQTSAGRPMDAVSTIRAFQQTSATWRGDARLDIVASTAFYSAGDLPSGLQAAQDAWRRASERKARSLQARARLQLGLGLMSQGRTGEAIEAAIDAKHLFAALGNLTGYARALLDTGNYLRAHTQGNLETRRALYEEGLAVYRKIGHKKGEGDALNNLAGIAGNQGNLARAQQLYEESLATRRLIDYRRGVALALNNIGDVAQQRGDLATAERLYTEALEAYRAAEAPDGVAFALSEIGDVKRLRGDLVEARRRSEESVRTWQATGQRNFYAAGALGGAGDVLRAMGDFDGARARYDEALTMVTVPGNPQASFEIELRVADLLLDTAKAAEAEALVRRLRQGFEREGQVISQIRADALLMRALLAQSKVPEAGAVLEHGFRLLAKGQRELEALEFEVVGAMVQTASGDHARAMAVLKAAIAKAKALDCLYCRLKAELTLGEIELAAGKVASSRERLLALDDEARAKGYLPVADHARRLVRQLNVASLPRF